MSCFPVALPMIKGTLAPPLFGPESTVSLKPRYEASANVVPVVASVSFRQAPCRYHFPAMSQSAVAGRIARALVPTGELATNALGVTLEEPPQAVRARTNATIANRSKLIRCTRTLPFTSRRVEREFAGVRRPLLQAHSLRRGSRLAAQGSVAVSSIRWHPDRGSRPEAGRISPPFPESS